MNESNLQTPRKKPSRGSVILLGFIIVLVIAAVLPNFVKARVTECQNSCINNLRQLDGAKEQWAIENDKSVGFVLSAEDEDAVFHSIKGGRASIKCPAGGRYTLGPIGSPPTCDATELPHVLPVN